MGNFTTSEPRLRDAGCNAIPANCYALRPARVLLVDDSKNDILLAQYYLLGQVGVGCELSVARSCREGLKILIEADEAQRKIDLILLDINMPGDGGFVLLEDIRNHPRLRNTPVVMCTGSAHEADRAQSRLFGAVGYILKPPSLEHLRKILDLLPTLDLYDDLGATRLMAIT